MLYSRWNLRGQLGVLKGLKIGGESKDERGKGVPVSIIDKQIEECDYSFGI